MKTASYGVDGYKYIVWLTSGGTLAVLTAFLLLAFGLRFPSACLFTVGTPALFTGLLGVRYVLVGKFRHRDRLLDTLIWSGHERVLDVGTGGGLLLASAAKRAPSGLAIGIDIWDKNDLSSNSPERALANLAIEGVSGNTEIKTEDARLMSFESATFDVVVSMLCIHNISDDAGQDAALAEIARVLSSGGTALISDLANTERYASVLRAHGLEVTRTGPFWDTFPFQYLVAAHKPIKDSVR
jgi:arsenite methyltransferase